MRQSPGLRRSDHAIDLFSSFGTHIETQKPRMGTGPRLTAWQIALQTTNPNPRIGPLTLPNVEAQIPDPDWISLPWSQPKYPTFFSSRSLMGPDRYKEAMPFSPGLDENVYKASLRRGLSQASTGGKIPLPPIEPFYIESPRHPHA